jgi:hypothetical protein
MGGGGGRDGWNHREAKRYKGERKKKNSKQKRKGKKPLPPPWLQE